MPARKVTGPYRPTWALSEKNRKDKAYTHKAIQRISNQESRPYWPLSGKADKEALLKRWIEQGRQIVAAGGAMANRYTSIVGRDGLSPEEWAEVAEMTKAKAKSDAQRPGRMAGKENITNGEPTKPQKRKRVVSDTGAANKRDRVSDHVASEGLSDESDKSDDTKSEAKDDLKDIDTNQREEDEGIVAKPKTVATKITKNSIAKCVKRHVPRERGPTSEDMEMTEAKPSSLITKLFINFLKLARQRPDMTEWLKSSHNISLVEPEDVQDHFDVLMGGTVDRVGVTPDEAARKIAAKKSANQLGKHKLAVASAATLKMNPELLKRMAPQEMHEMQNDVPAMNVSDPTPESSKKDCRPQDAHATSSQTQALNSEESVDLVEAPLAAGSETKAKTTSGQDMDRGTLDDELEHSVARSSSSSDDDAVQNEDEVSSSKNDTDPKADPRATMRWSGPKEPRTFIPGGYTDPRVAEAYPVVNRTVSFLADITIEEARTTNPNYLNGPMYEQWLRRIREGDLVEEMRAKYLEQMRPIRKKPKYKWRP